ncbi:hydrogenase nickel incorporation protein HypB [Anaerosacchariphilus polymeriproducens]|uniref:Hydrogenase accessory protein HypB n=1 Tax=Anaerosacchariphilus polymeriproducens TaxID=1812858 RepID=A0A371AUM8_9FIRM|nr:hydrogenase nickel incorporation protein HypB [Anaerosacchariphilus polymeriproducens]RDU23274.1 hydrogenase accessory protein HypB [Anaerosacchariphilus polymeriproducens]
MSDIKLIDIKQNILSDNDNQADIVREDLKKKNTYMINLMASPGSGKTSTILQTVKNLRDEIKIGVIEGDIESLVDSEKMKAQDIPVVQIRTGGACHLDAPMITPALDELMKEELDLIFVENIGNLVCPAEFDIGANLRVMILSIPEGDDKVLKYPLMFSVSDVLLINKVDTVEVFDFNKEKLYERVKALNPDVKIFEISCKTGEGISEWCNFLKERVNQ